MKSGPGYQKPDVHHLSAGDICAIALLSSWSHHGRNAYRGCAQFCAEVWWPHFQPGQLGLVVEEGLHRLLAAGLAAAWALVIWNGVGGTSTVALNARR